MGRSTVVRGDDLVQPVGRGRAACSMETAKRRRNRARELGEELGIAVEVAGDPFAWVQGTDFHKTIWVIDQWTGEPSTPARRAAEPQVTASQLEMASRCGPQHDLLPGAMAKELLRRVERCPQQLGHPRVGQAQTVQLLIGHQRECVVLQGIAVEPLYEPGAVLALPNRQIAAGAGRSGSSTSGCSANGPTFEPGPQRPPLRNGDLALTSARIPAGATTEVARRQPDGTWLWTIDQPSILGR